MKNETYIIELTGYGGEIVLGTIDPEVHEYFQENNLEYDEFANDWDNEMDVPEDMQPFAPGEWHDCDNIAHETGVEMSELCNITVYNSAGDVVWESGLDTAALTAAGVTVDCSEETLINDQDVGTVVFQAQSIEKGTFFSGEIKLTGEFDPAKMSLYYADIEGWPLCANVEYDGVEVDGLDNYSTTGKSLDMSVTVVGE
jgi:hypothetical protein